MPMRIDLDTRCPECGAAIVTVDARLPEMVTYCETGHRTSSLDREPPVARRSPDAEVSPSDYGRVLLVVERRDGTRCRKCVRPSSLLFNRKHGWPGKRWLLLAYDLTRYKYITIPLVAIRAWANTPDDPELTRAEQQEDSDA